ncbi:hypothetical protein [Actinosynnema sp. NPDC023587]|uniref:hypothetical protein n=1 Tax=Actinosynnema sp. NPDC023587 TaxID=3154695 RepID=UPI0034069165
MNTAASEAFQDEPAVQNADAPSDIGFDQPTMFSIVLGGEPDEAEVAGWGLAFHDHVQVCLEDGGRLTSSSAEAAAAFVSLSEGEYASTHVAWYVSRLHSAR